MKRGKMKRIIENFVRTQIYITEVTLLYIVFSEKKEKSDEGY